MKIITSIKRSITRESLIEFIQKGSGNIYVIAILGTIVAGSALMVGGLVPQLEPPPDDAQAVQVDTTIDPSERNNALELRSFGILTPTVTPPNTPGPTNPVCFDKAAVAIVVDVSGSMDSNLPGTTVSRLDRLKAALKRFIGNFSNDSALSLISFNNTGQILVPMGKLSTNKTTLTNAINALTPGGSTNMRSGLANADNVLDAARPTLPNYNQYTVFMTDGVPENGACLYRRPTGVYHYYSDVENEVICTLAGTNTEPTFATHVSSPIGEANQIKADGAKLFSIALFEETGVDSVERDKNNKAEDLMRDVASDPNSTYYTSNPTTKDLEETYQEIARKICP